MKKVFVLLFLSILVAVQSNGQIRSIFTDEVSISHQVPDYIHTKGMINTKEIDYIPSEKLLRAPTIDDTVEVSKVLQFAEPIQVKIGTEDGDISKTPHGTVWSLRISVPNASNIRLIFDEFYLSPTAEMYIFNEPINQLDSAVTMDKFSYTEFVSSSVFNGKSVVVYIVDFGDNDFVSKISISTIYVGPYIFDDAQTFSDIGIMSSSCIPVVTCYQNRMPYARAVARVSVGGSGGTGTLLNNESDNGRAFFLTAFHVVDLNDNGFLDPAEITALSSAIFQFQYWRNSCTGSINNGITFTGAQAWTYNANTDMILLELLNPPGVGDGVNYAGWNRDSSSPPSGFVIHHPEGNDMRYSSSSSISTSILHDQYWRVTYTTGVTRPGSSGSALFNNNSQVIGQLWGGASSCTFTDFGDRYGKFDKSWSSTVRNLLSPTFNRTAISLLNVHEMQIEGGGTVPCDGTLVSYRVPDLLGCTYNWDVTFNMDIVSGQGTNVVSVKKNAVYSDIPEGIVSVTITDSKGYNKTVNLSKQVTVGFPDGYILKPEVSGPSCTSSSSLILSIGASYNDNTSCNLRYNAAISEIEWDITSDFPYTISENSGIFSCTSTSLVNKAGLSVNFASQPNPYVVTIRLRAKDICGTWSGWTPGFYHVVRRCSFVYSYEAKYDPQLEAIEIHANREKSNNILFSAKQIGLKLMDNMGNVLIDESRDFESGMSVSTKGFKSGVYFLDVSVGEQSEICEIVL